MRHRRQILARWYAIVISVSSSCTPISAVQKGDISEQAPRHSQAADSTATVPIVSTERSAPTIVTAQVATECSEPGARSCAEGETRMLLLCSDGVWTAQASCGMSERCEITAGPEAALCVSIATQCLTHEPGEEFCDGEFVRTCENLALIDARKCRERRRCMENEGTAECVCAFGWVDFGIGRGCERLTESILLIGSPGDASNSQGLMGEPNLDAARNSGAMYTYGRTKDQWVVTAYIKPSNSGTSDSFGTQMAIYGDTIVSTANGEASDASGVQGNQTNNALNHAGAAYVFR